jgi:hypothetical protein
MRVTCRVCAASHTSFDTIQELTFYPHDDKAVATDLRNTPWSEVSVWLTLSARWTSRNNATVLNHAKARVRWCVMVQQERHAAQTLKERLYQQSTALSQLRGVLRMSDVCGVESCKSESSFVSDGAARETCCTHPTGAIVPTVHGVESTPRCVAHVRRMWC